MRHVAANINGNHNGSVGSIVCHLKIDET